MLGVESPTRAQTVIVACYKNTMCTQGTYGGVLTTVGLITAILTVIESVTLCVLFQDAGAAFALISDCRAGRFWWNKSQLLVAKRHVSFYKVANDTYHECSWVHRLHLCSLSLHCILAEDAGDYWHHSSSWALLWKYASFFKVQTEFSRK